MESSKKPVVIIDDAQDMSEEALLSIKAMVNFDQDSASRICFVLAGRRNCGKQSGLVILNHSDRESSSVYILAEWVWKKPVAILIIR